MKSRGEIMLTENQGRGTIKVKIFSSESYEKLENEVNEWLSNCEEHIFDIIYKHCFTAWPEPDQTAGLGMEREFSVMVVYGQTGMYE
jgi:hypothetical protein